MMKIRIASVVLAASLVAMPVAASNWVLVEHNMLYARQDLYIDTNSREQLDDGKTRIVTLTNNYESQGAVSEFIIDQNGEQHEIFLHDKVYRSIVQVEIFDCAKETSGSIDRYMSGEMGTGREVYRRDSLFFIPFIPVIQDKTFQFACGFIPS
jgi:hypothetical protein